MWFGKSRQCSWLALNVRMLPRGDMKSYLWATSESFSSLYYIFKYNLTAWKHISDRPKVIVENSCTLTTTNYQKPGWAIIFANHKESHLKSIPLRHFFSAIFPCTYCNLLSLWWKYLAMLQHEVKVFFINMCYCKPSEHREHWTCRSPSSQYFPSLRIQTSSRSLIRDTTALQRPTGTRDIKWKWTQYWK